MFAQHVHQIRRARALSLLALALAAGCGDGPVASEPTKVQVAEVEVSPGTHTLRSGEVYHFTARPRAADGTALQERVEWLSSDEQVAGVDVNGTVSARSPGTVVISARSGGRTGRASLTVQAVPVVASVEITPASPLTVGVGGTRQLAAVVRAADGSVITGRAVEWLSSDTLVARVSAAGLAEGRAEGQAVISARVDGMTAQASLVVAFSQSPDVPVGSVEVQAPKGRVEPGESMQLLAIVRAPSGPALERAVEWSTDNPAVATVDAAGRLTGHATGWVRIKASAGGKHGYLEVQVARWTRQELLAMDGRALPGSFTTHVPSADGTTQTVQWRVDAGLLRTLDGVGMGHFELLLAGWFTPSTGVGTQASYQIIGSFQRDPSNGGITFYPAGGDPFTGVLQADGKLVIGLRIRGSTAPTELVFAGR